MENKKTKIALGIAIFLLLIAVGYIVNEKVVAPYYFNQGQQQGAFDVVQQINSQGTIPVVNNNTIQWISIQQICGAR